MAVIDNELPASPDLMGMPAPKPEKEETPKDYDDVLAEARERYTKSQDDDRDNKKAAKDDTEFVYIAGKQWPQSMRDEREAADDVCLEFPQMKQFVNQVINDQRQSRPGIRVHPAGGQSSKEVAEILQGMCRHIEYDSSAEAVYDGGFQHAVVGGRGFWRIISEFESAKSFDQVLRIKRIPDPDVVTMDMDYQEPDASDVNFYFIGEKVSKKAFEKLYPDAEPLSWDPSDTGVGWYNGNDEVIIADYYRRVATDRELVALSDGSVGWLDEIPTKIPLNITITACRMSKEYRVECFKIAGGEQVLEETDIPGTIIPVVCCMGDEIIVDGKRVFQGLIRQARDAQVMYNFEQSQKVTLYATAPRAPWIVAEESIDGAYEDEWKNANKRNYSHLTYRHKDSEGNPIPPPQRTQFAPVATGWAEAAQQSKDDIKSVIGMYQNSLGMHGQETSGRAILAREKQGDNATFHFADNLARAIALTGKIIVGQIPTFYDTQRIVGIAGVDGKRSKVTINQTTADPMDPTRAIVMNDVTSGEYSVVVEAGPSYATKQDQTRESLMSLVQSFPPIMQMAGDLIVGNLDFPDSDKLAARLKVMLPPPVQALIAKEDNPQGPQPPSPEVQAQMTQMQQQLQQAAQMVQQLQQENAQLKQGDAADQAKANSTIAIAQQKAAEDIQLAREKAQADLELEKEKALEQKDITIAKALIDKETRIEVAKVNAEAALLEKQILAPPELMPDAPDGDEATHAPDMAAMMQQMMTAITAPKHHQILLDEQGNPTGMISRPVPPQSPPMGAQ